MHVIVAIIQGLLPSQKPSALTMTATAAMMLVFKPDSQIDQVRVSSIASFAIL